MLILTRFPHSAEDAQVYPGVTPFGENNGLLKISKTIIHPQYALNKRDFNICMMLVEIPMRFGRGTQQAALASVGNSLPRDLHDRFVVSGWGRLNFQDPPILPAQMQINEFNFYRDSLSNFVNLKPASVFIKGHSYDQPTYGDGGAACYHRESATVYGLVVDSDDLRNEDPTQKPKPRQCLLLDTLRKWIDETRETIMEG